MRKRNPVGNYTSRIEEIKEELKTKTLGEAERDRNISVLDYTGVGFGYNLKAIQPKTIKDAEKACRTPNLDRLEALARRLG
jgi:hypothetical protein